MMIKIDENHSILQAIPKDFSEIPGSRILGNPVQQIPGLKFLIWPGPGHHCTCGGPWHHHHHHESLTCGGLWQHGQKPWQHPRRTSTELQTRYFHQSVSPCDENSIVCLRLQNCEVRFHLLVQGILSWIIIKYVTLQAKLAHDRSTTNQLAPSIHIFCSHKNPLLKCFRPPPPLVSNGQLLLYPTPHSRLT